MTGSKTRSPIPWFLMTALLGLVPVLNNKYPAQFFPAVSPWWVEVISVFLGVLSTFWGFSRGWEILQRRSTAREWVRQTMEKRHMGQKLADNDINNAGRLISRLVRNVDEDLMEIKPDFSEGSLKRLRRYLPALLDEIENEEDAFIRLGVVGTYLGESACRNSGWQWHFNADPGLRQFSYLASTIRKNGKELDPFDWGAGLLIGKRNENLFMKEIK